MKVHQVYNVQNIRRSTLIWSAWGRSSVRWSNIRYLDSEQVHHKHYFTKKITIVIFYSRVVFGYVIIFIAARVMFRTVRFRDMAFPVRGSEANFDGRQMSNLSTEDFYKIIMCKESTILSRAREDWIPNVAPKCSTLPCRSTKNRTSYMIENKAGVQCWRYRCCRCTESILKKSIFYKSRNGPGRLLEIIQFFSARVPVGVISELVFGCTISSVFSWARLFVAGYYEDAFTIKMGGPNIICEGKGTVFLQHTLAFCTFLRKIE